MMVPRGDEEWGEVEEVKGGQIYGDKETTLWVVSIQCNIQMIDYRIVQLKLI